MKKASKNLLFVNKKFFKHMRRFIFVLILVFFIFFFAVTSILAIYEGQFVNKVYPGIKVGDADVSAKTREEVWILFEAKNKSFASVLFTFRHEGKIATVSAATIELGYNSKLIADQAYIIGRTGNIFADVFNKGGVWWGGGVLLPPSYMLNRNALESALVDIAKEVTVAPVDAIFETKDNKVIAFRLSVPGQAIDTATLEEAILGNIPQMLKDNSSRFEIELPIKTIKPKVSLEDINSLGIKEYVGRGVSKFRGSIPNRIHNIVLAASRVDGTIVKPGQVFSFNNAVGDVSKFTGYKEAYIIKDGKTILGDGGGVCQVSTTLFRAVLNSGLPVVERHSHSYRVSYYEQDSPPGLDATVYAPSYDLRFKNDMAAAILIEAHADVEKAMLVFDFYGTSDGREASLTKPVITAQVPAPDDQYLDDPNLPIGVVKQIDFKAAGAKVTFSHTIKRSGEVLGANSFISNYRPWQAVFLRGTKE